MVKCKGKVKEFEKRMLTALAFKDGLIANQCRLKLKENHEANLITKNAFFGSSGNE